MNPKNTLQLCEFDFDLPRELIAQYPLEKRDQARLLGRREKTQGKVEVFLLKKLPGGDGCSYETIIRPLNRLKINEKIQFNGGSLTVELIDIGKRIVRFNRKEVAAQLKKPGHMPLPPYIKRPDEPL